MKRVHLSFMLSVIFIVAVCLFSLANEIDDAKAVLIKAMPSLSGEGAVVSGPMSIDDIEKESLQKMSESKNAPQVPFGRINNEWLKFKSQYKVGDVILYFHTDSKSWSGSEGYALIRGKKIIDTILTMDWNS